MTIDAVVGGISDAVLKPFDEDVRFVERGVFDLVKRLHPMNALGLLGPKRVRIGERALICFLILRLIDEGALGPFGGHVIDLVGHVALLHSHAGVIDRRFPVALCDGALRTDKAQGPRRAAALRATVAMPPTHQGPMAPMIAPMTSRTSSQLPASISNSRRPRPPKL